MTEAAGLGEAEPSCQAYAGASSNPVFVLCTGRSGSTLLRVLLDTHPDLACPPETKFPEVIGRLITLWAAMEALPLPAQVPADGQIAQSAAIVIHGIRHTVDLIVGPYLARRGKKRYCDKNLGTAQYADMLLSAYPEAKFICLHRHPMDVIASGIEACPWGLAPSDTDGDAWWLVDPAARKVLSGSGTCDEDARWTVIAPAATWEQVIRDGVNIGTAFRRQGMRYQDRGDGPPGSVIAESRVAMLGDLLGITSWRPSASAVPLTRDGT